VRRSAAPGIRRPSGSSSNSSLDRIRRGGKSAGPGSPCSRPLPWRSREAVHAHRPSDFSLFRKRFVSGTQILTFFGPGLYRPNERKRSYGTVRITRTHDGDHARSCRPETPVPYRRRPRRRGAQEVCARHGYAPPVETLEAAPLGDPIEYRVKGYCLLLRRASARLIEVVPEEG